MQSSDLHYLQRVLALFISASIQRVPNSGQMVHRFSISVDEFKLQTNRNRLHASVINDVIGFFNRQNVDASYDTNYSSFDIFIDLEKCVLDPGQASNLAKAIDYYRTHFES